MRSNFKTVLPVLERAGCKYIAQVFTEEGGFEPEYAYLVRLQGGIERTFYRAELNPITREVSIITVTKDFTDFLSDVGTKFHALLRTFWIATSIQYIP